MEGLVQINEMLLTISLALPGRYAAGGFTTGIEALEG